MRGSNSNMTEIDFGKNSEHENKILPANYVIRPATADDKNGVIDIFNHYIEHTYAAYPDKKVPYEFYGMLMQLARGYPFYVAVADSNVIGYGLLRPHVPMSTFQRSAELTCFLSPGQTGKGIGTAILGRLISDAKGMGIDTILASVSSENQSSIAFHLKHGFSECGRFRHVARKFDKEFDEVWLQLSL